MNTDSKLQLDDKCPAPSQHSPPCLHWFGVINVFGFIAIILTSTLLLSNSSLAQKNALQYSSYVTPFPDRGIYRVLVLGDSIGQGLSAGLAKAFQNDRSLQLINKAKWGTGFSRRKHIGRSREFDPLLKSIKPDMVIISVGAKDAVASILEGRKNIALARSAGKKFMASGWTIFFVG